MNLPGVLLLFALYTLVVAAAVAIVIYFSTRRRREPHPGIVIPNVSGLNLAPLAGRNVISWPLHDSPSATPPDDLDLEAVILDPPDEIFAVEGSELLAEEYEDAAPVRDDEPERAPAEPEPLVFSGQLLPEGLRTLEVTPSRTVEAGQVVHAVFTFRNLGGGTANGFRVHFRLPEGLTYVAGSARIDDTPLDEEHGETALLQPAGADIGEIPAGGERRASLAFAVAATIENGSTATPITAPDSASSRR